MENFIPKQEARESVKFMEVVADVGILVSGASGHLNLESIKNEFGHNFNTLIIVNNSTEEISLKLDGRQFTFINGNKGGISLDWRDGVIFDDIQIKNEDGVNPTSANEIRVSVGRTGQPQNL